MERETNMADMVSILTPVYNGAEYIATALESVAQQTYGDWEMIVVDDGSTDATAEVVHRYTDPRIRYTYQPNRGQAAALNTGLALAQGSYITTLDADDWLTTDSLENRVQLLDTRLDLGAVYCDGWYCSEAGTPVLRLSEYRPANPEGDIYDDLTVTCFFGTGAPVMIRRTCLEAPPIRYDEAIAMVQDWDFYVRVAEVARFGYVPKIGMWYRLHATNMTMSMSERRKQESFVRFKRKVMDSPRFAAVAPEFKYLFFHNLLLQDLRRQTDEQRQVVAHPAFQALPVPTQARLLRLLASDCLLAGDCAEAPQEWLRQARALAPYDAKNRLVSGMATFSPRLTRLAIESWRRRPGQTRAISVLDLALQADK